MPLPAFVRVPAPVREPESVSEKPAVSKVPPPPLVPRVIGNAVEKEPAAWSVPPLKLKYAGTGSYVSADVTSRPPARLYVPLYPNRPR